MVTIERYFTLDRAYLARGLLESAGIECVLLDENIMRIHWLCGPAIGGVRLQVAEEDAASAREILDSAQPFLVEKDDEE